MHRKQRLIRIIAINLLLAVLCASNISFAFYDSISSGLPTPASQANSLDESLNGQGTEQITSASDNTIFVDAGLITVRVTNYPVTDLLTEVFDQANQKVVINNKIDEHITIKLEKVTLEHFLNVITANLNLQWIDKNGTYLISSEEKLISVEFFPIKSASLSDVQNALTVLLLGERVVISPYPRGIIVSATPNNLREIASIIEKIDQPVPSIRVEFQVVEVNREQAERLGIDWTDLMATGQYSYKKDTFPTGVITGTATASMIISGQNRRNYGKILACPYIITVNNVEAHLSTGDEVPIFSKDSAGNPSVDYKKVGIELFATPSVVDLEKGILNIKAKAVVNIISGQQTQQNLTAPQISSREAQTVMNIKSGHTIVIGGLIKEEEIRSESGLPLLSKIPIVGNLFKTTTKNKLNTEVLIFITATLCD